MRDAGEIPNQQAHLKGRCQASRHRSPTLGEVGGIAKKPSGAREIVDNVEYFSWETIEEW